MKMSEEAQQLGMYQMIIKTSRLIYDVITTCKFHLHIVNNTPQANESV